MRIPNIGADLATVTQSQEEQVPKGAKDLVFLATSALNAKDQQDYRGYQNALSELRIAKDKELLSQKELLQKETQKYEQQIMELMQKANDVDMKAKSQDRQIAIGKQVEDLFKKGDPQSLKTAFRMLSLYQGTDAQKYKTLLQQISVDLAQDPLAKEVMGLSQSGLDPKSTQVFIYQWLVRGIHQHRREESGIPAVAPKADEQFLPPGVSDPNEVSHQRNLNKYFGHKRGNLQPVGQDTFNPVADAQPQQQRWDTNDILNWQRFSGLQPGRTTEIEAAAERGDLTPEQTSAAYEQEFGTLKQPTEKVLEAQWLITQGLQPQEVIQKVWGLSGGREGAEAWKERVYQDIMQTTQSGEMTRAEGLKLASHLFGNRDISERTFRYASDPDPAIEMLPPRWKQSLAAVFAAEDKSFGTPGLRTVTRRIVEIEETENLTEKEKDDRIYPLVRIAINTLEKSRTRANEIDGLVDLFDHIKTVEDYIKRFPSGIDPNAPGRWQNAVLEFFKAFGLTYQDDLAALDTTQDLNVALFVKSISGAAVTDQERQFLSKIMTQTRDGHKLSQAKIDGLRYFVGKRLSRYYGEKQADRGRGLGMVEYLLKGTLPEGEFTEDGEFVRTKRTEKPKPKPTEDGSLGEVKGMRPTTQAQTGDPEFMAVWNDFDASQRKSLVNKAISKHGIEKAQTLLSEAGVDASELSKYFSGTK